MQMRPMYRVTTFVPLEHLESLLAGVGRMSGLTRGKYDQVAWWSEATEQFRPLSGAKPTVGSENQVTRVASVRVEFALPRDPELLQEFLATALIPNHPWEEPAVFIDETLATLVQE